MTRKKAIVLKYRWEAITETGYMLAAGMLFGIFLMLAATPVLAIIVSLAVYFGFSILALVLEAKDYRKEKSHGKNA